MNEKLYSLGEMARLGLIKNRRGGAVRQISNLTLIVRKLDYVVVATKWGPAKCLSQAQIDAYNSSLGSPL